MGTLILIGFGIGIGAQAPFMVPQTIYSGPDISLGTSVVIFSDKERNYLGFGSQQHLS